MIPFDPVTPIDAELVEPAPGVLGLILRRDGADLTRVEVTLTGRTPGQVAEALLVAAAPLTTQGPWRVTCAWCDAAAEPGAPYPPLLAAIRALRRRAHV